MEWYVRCCVDEPFVHGLTRREAGQVERVEDVPNELNASVILSIALDDVNIFSQNGENAQSQWIFHRR